MKILENECLKKYTTIRIGGYAKCMYFPENTNELIALINSFPNKDYYLLGGGSNILINDKKVYDNVIMLNQFDNMVRNLGNGEYYVGSATRIQKLIDLINQDGFGGIEYLYSVPGLVGGTIVMNAGRGRQNGVSISDYIKNVHVCINGSVFILDKDKCEFSYRSSIFKNSKNVVLGATFCFTKMEQIETNLEKQNRLALCKKVQDNSGYNFGSVFMKSDYRLMWLIRLFSPGYKNGIVFSKKTINWLLNKGDGTFYQAMKLIDTIKKIHRFMGREASTEVIIWK